METECIPDQMEFQQLGRRAVIGRFNGGIISSDGGAVLLREVDRRTGISEGLARCFQGLSQGGSDRTLGGLHDPPACLWDRARL